MLMRVMIGLNAASTLVSPDAAQQPDSLQWCLSCGQRQLGAVLCAHGIAYQRSHMLSWQPSIEGGQTRGKGWHRHWNLSQRESSIVDSSWSAHPQWRHSRWRLLVSSCLFPCHPAHMVHRQLGHMFGRTVLHSVQKACTQARDSAAHKHHHPGCARA